MAKRFDLIVFDWDGTLADSTQIIVDSIRRAAVETGLKDPGQEAASSIIGLGLREAIEQLFGVMTQEQIQQMAARYNMYYNAHQDDVVLFDHAYDTVRRLNEQGYMLGVATGKGRRGLNHALAHSGLGEFIHATRCVDECPSKPHPQMLLELMGEFGVEPERTLMIGDTSFDLQMAQNAKVSSLGVTYGAHPLERLLPHSPLAHFDDFATLSQWLQENA
ncbi:MULTISPECIES: HAD-IIIA family hydrolase [Methylobacillus]|uniref:HAD-superfamily hydrolase, subfamily IA, variant 1 n=1 Tax=Methylobacillus flagellatus (strain ATCC 51484 / DSM 6875 / VKM B-1610 / KT) TaxID=265072 RepID=Q1H1P6_METFK|nr:MULTISPECIES: HAD-IIIA family hydrolase [Methylobacillus]ABE49591.1 HAD-superfamily hydrolase, subfamily IA, variant 1 [Methylobacillus flagellatus KT]MPS47857.1 HAD-IIIA family hydrolase [Methylobacillus sp.]